MQKAKSGLRKTLVPTFREENILQKQGYKFVAGIDEVGRGCLAGPVAAAAVILHPGYKTGWLKQIRDSKKLTADKREYLSVEIRKAAVAVGIGFVSAEEIDNHGIVRATRQAMKKAIGQLSPSADSLLIDYFRLPDIELPQKGVLDGDSLCISIACASIIAKVARDHLMVELDGTYPGYRFANHKGYGTKEHRSCLEKLGLSPIHRHSFGLVGAMGSEEDD